MHAAQASADETASHTTFASEGFRRDFSLRRELPANLAALDRISLNFAWSWLPGGVDLFRRLEPKLWDDCEQNPRELLTRIDDLRLLQASADADYLRALAAFDARLDQYLAKEFGDLGQVTQERPAAYFCAEYGVHNSLPNYSGGLGILAGDHLKSASDLGVPLVAVGLLYRYGYFRQRISHDGWQEERYQDLFASELALTPVVDDAGERIKVSVHIRGREVHAQAWLARVGRVPLYLLDSNLPENDEIDRLITGHLYGGDTETRIVQEKLLGIGGVRLLRRLDCRPSVFHLNEGHSAFLTLELATEYIHEHPEASFDDARQAVRRQCVFTTHTPVEAGNDVFDPEVLKACFRQDYIAALKLSREDFAALGRTDPSNAAEPFGMTPFALRMCRSANGVAARHGEVSRKLWLKMFPEVDGPDQVPIGHVTNGVHAPTWIAPLFEDLFERRIGPRWLEVARDPAAWRSALDTISDDEIWSVHSTLKELLVAFVRVRTKRTDIGGRDTINERLDTSSLLSPSALTIGFARRVAAYKRWDLILSDVERLLRLVDDAERPVQFVFAGKAHPQDRPGKEMLQKLMGLNHNSGWQSRAVFIEDYDQEIARYLVHGVDVWMNVPRRPLEASGTSGMKAAMNGVLNFSILDGWWIEGFNGENGFAIAGLDDSGDAAATDAADVESLYDTLESSIIPAFYARDERGVPVDWVRRMKNAIATLTPQFSADRMVSEYVERIYNG
ncbi:MAG: alpha-glucan family phosphorylase [Pyrinomonadaceae bacterium]